jgi:hypothetical protein
MTDESTPPQEGIPQAPQDQNPADQAIGMEANIMLKSVRAPESGPLPEEVRAQIRETVAAHAKQHKIGHRVLGQQVGAGESAISEVLRGIYKGDSDSLLRKLNRWIDDDERRRQRAKPIGFYPTCVFESIRALAAFAKSNARLPDSTKNAAVAADPPRIAVGWAPAGSGKSLGARALNAEDPASILIRVEARHGGDSALAKLIIAAAGWRGRARDRGLIEFVIEKLRESGRLLIVDEAHRLQTSGCEFIRDLVDVCGIPVLLLATEEFYERMTSVRTGGGRKIYDQFSRRVGYVLNLLRGVDGKGGTKRPIFSEEEVRAIFRVQGLRITHDGIEYLQAAACTIGLGMLGLAANIFELAVRSALRKNRILDAELMRRMAQRLLIPAGEADAGVLRQIEATLQRHHAMESGRAAAAG